MTDIQGLLGDEAEALLSYECKGVPKDDLTLPGADIVERVYKDTDRNAQVLRNLQGLIGHGRLAGSGHVSILPVDQGIEHSAAASFAPNPKYFDPKNIVELAIEGGCNAVASTLRRAGHVLAAIRAPHPVHRQAEPQRAADVSDRVRPDHVRLAGRGVEPRRRRLSAPRSTSGPTTLGVSSSRSARRSSKRTSSACSRSCGATCATPDFAVDGVNYEDSADLTGQANHLGVTIEADIIKQKQPTKNGGFPAVGFGKTSPLVYNELVADNPIDWCRWQVVNCYMGRIGLINSGGESKGASDLADAVRTAVINKRAGGTGLISGRKAFQRPMAEGVELLHAIQDVYLDDSVTVA